eukprot:52330-Rhodomonas_salina.1
MGKALYWEFTRREYQPKKAQTPTVLQQHAPSACSQYRTKRNTQPFSGAGSEPLHPKILQGN